METKPLMFTNYFGRKGGDRNIKGDDTNSHIKSPKQRSKSRKRHEQPPKQPTSDSQNNSDTNPPSSSSPSPPPTTTTADANADSLSISELDDRLGHQLENCETGFKPEEVNQMGLTSSNVDSETLRSEKTTAMHRNGTAGEVINVDEKRQYGDVIGDEGDGGVGIISKGRPQQIQIPSLDLPDEKQTVYRTPRRAAPKLRKLVKLPPRVRRKRAREELPARIPFETIAFSVVFLFTVLAVRPFVSQWIAHFCGWVVVGWLGFWSHHRRVAHELAIADAALL